MKYKMINEVENKEINCTHEMMLFDHLDSDAKEPLVQILNNIMTKTDDPDIADKDATVYVENLYNGKLGSISSGIVMLSQLNDEISGIAIALLDGEYYRITTIGVLEKYRNQGVGTSLYFPLMKKLNHLGVDKVILDVHSKNTPAVKMYQKLGFQLMI